MALKPVSRKGMATAIAVSLPIVPAALSLAPICATNSLAAPLSTPSTIPVTAQFTLPRDLTKTIRNWGLITIHCICMHILLVVYVEELILNSW